MTDEQATDFVAKKLAQVIAEGNLVHFIKDAVAMAWDQGVKHHADHGDTTISGLERCLSENPYR